MSQVMFLDDMARCKARIVNHLNNLQTFYQYETRNKQTMAEDNEMKMPKKAGDTKPNGFLNIMRGWLLILDKTNKRFLWTIFQPFL